MIVLRTLILTTILFIACWFTLPPVVSAGNHNHGISSHGIDILLATGMVAKLLQKKKNGFGGRSNQVPIGGHARENPYGAQSVRIMVPHASASLPPRQSVPMHYQQPIQQPQTMVTYSQSTHLMPQQVPPQAMAQHTMPQAPIVHSGYQGHNYPGSNYPGSSSQQTTVYGYFTELQPKDQVEVVRM